MTFRLALSSELLLRLYRALVVFVAGITGFYTLTLALGPYWKIGGVVALALSTWGCLKLVSRMSAKEVFAPLSISGWALFAFLLFLAFSHAPIYRGEPYLGDWAKHRSVLISLNDRMFSPKASGFLYDETAVGSVIPAEYLLNYYYLPYIAPVIAYKPVKALIPEYSSEAVARVLAALLCLGSLVLLLWSVTLALSASHLLWKTNVLLSESTITLFLLIFPIWGGGEFFLEIYRQGAIPTLGPHYDGIVYEFFPFQVQNIVSLWNWAPSQMAAASVALALVIPFIRRVDLAPWPIIVSFLMGSVPFALFGLVPIAVFGALQFRATYTLGWLKSQFKSLALQLVLCGLLGLQAVVFFHGKTLQDIFQSVFAISQNYPNYFISILREYLPFCVILLALTVKRFISWPAFAGLVLLQLGMTTVYFGHFNPWALKSTIPTTLLLPVFFAYLIASIARWRTQALVVVLALVFFLPSFYYEAYFAWNDASHSAILEKTKWIVDQYLGR